MDMIEQLYYGNISPNDRHVRPDSVYAKLLSHMARHEEKLLAELPAEMKESFEKFRDCASELNGKNELAAFTLGFKLGLRLTTEAFVEQHTELDEISC